MARFTCTADSVAAGVDLPIVNLTGSAAIRIHLYDLVISSDDTPSDQATRYSVQTTTDVGVGGTGLANETPLDPLSVGAVGDAIKGTFTTKPTTGAILLLFSVNQRATFRWVAAPGSELMSPAAAGDGLMVNSENSTGTPGTECTMLWWE